MKTPWTNPTENNRIVPTANWLILTFNLFIFNQSDCFLPKEIALNFLFSALYFLKIALLSANQNTEIIVCVLLAVKRPFKICLTNSTDVSAMFSPKIIPQCIAFQVLEVNASKVYFALISLFFSFNFTSYSWFIDHIFWWENIPLYM